MKKRKPKPNGKGKPSGPYPAEQLLTAVPYRNRAMETHEMRDGGLVVEIPMRRPRWLVPPISWILPYSSHRRVQLDAPGVEVLDLCDGRRTVEEIVEKFAAGHKLTFREAQLSVTMFLKQLTQRGLVAIVGTQ